MKKIAYVRIETEYSDNYYYCEVCGESLTKIIRKIFKKLLLRFMQNASGVLPNSKLVKIPHLYCSGCKRRLNFSKLGLSAQIGLKSASVKAKRISKLPKSKKEA